MSTTITLTEWRPTEVALPPTVVQELLATHGRHMTISPTGRADVWVLRPSSTVGTFRVADHRFLIRTKVALPNLLAMMDVPISSEVITPDVIELAVDTDLQQALVRLFCVAVEATTQRGIRRDYVRQEERLLAPRGRIDLREVVRSPGIDSPIPCVYDDHIADTPLNRLLRAALLRCTRMLGIHPGWRRRLVMQLHELDDVGDHVDLGWARQWTPAPMERHYTTAASLARWILEGGGAADQHGADPVSSFLLDMNQLFEDFVTREVMAALPHMHVTAQARQSLGRDGAVLMKPDIEIAQDKHVIAVADCKYKVLDDELARSHDYYQILAYATAYGLEEAWLLYARGPSDPALRDVEVRNASISLRTASFDLQAPVAELRRAIDETAHRITSAAHAPAA